MRYVPDAIVRLYGRSPIWTRSVASTCYGVLKSRLEDPKSLGRHLQELEESQWWSLERLEQLQQERLRTLVQHAASHVPYYRNVIAEYGISPRQIQTRDDLGKLPTLSKEIVRRNTRSLIADGYNITSLHRESTSGTTGTPLSVYMDARTFTSARALELLHRRWAGYTREQWIGVLAGYKVIPLDRRKPPFWVRNYFGRQIHFSTYHLCPSRAGAYLNEMESSGIEYLSGYPSAIGLLAYSARMLNRFLPLRGVFLSSEPILPWQRESIKKAFACPIYDYYGQHERVVGALGCGTDINLHISMDTGIIEFVPNGLVGGRTMVVGTSLLNHAMPLIRYEINDIAGPVHASCACRRHHPLMTPVETKAEDFLVTPEGNFLSASLLTFAFKTAKGIESSQIVQEDLQHMTVRLIPTPPFGKEDATNLIMALRQLVGNTIQIDVQTVDEIPRTQNGKFRFVISDVARKELGLQTEIPEAYGGNPVPVPEGHRGQQRCHPQDMRPPAAPSIHH